MARQCEGMESGAWLATVAAALQSVKPGVDFTVGEAIDEIRIWAGAARQHSWDANEESLRYDIAQLTADLGPSLLALLTPALAAIANASDRGAIGAAAAVFADLWRQKPTIQAAFRDLCDLASDGNTVSRSLRPRASIIASQLGAQSSGAWNPLRDAVGALTGHAMDIELTSWFGAGRKFSDVPLAERRHRAEELLLADPTIGDVVVWLIFDRARVPWRITAGPITFLQGEWMVPNAMAEDGKAFPERGELRSVLAEVGWAADLVEAVSDPEATYAIVRVALGTRDPAGAERDSARRVDAVLSLAAGAGGVTWRSLGSSATVVDGRVISESFGRSRDEWAKFNDTFGIRITAEAIEHAAGALNEAMSRSPMPDYLVDALVALRDAAMTDHRDVTLLGERGVPLRVAIALEDHAIELVGSIASVTPNDLARTLEQREVDRAWLQDVLGGLTAPFEIRDGATWVERQELERAVAPRENGVRVVSIPDVVASQGRILELPMTDLARSDFLDAIAAVSDADREATLRHHHAELTRVTRTRHRRVRNAVTHGNPLTDRALASVRQFSKSTSADALELALSAYAAGESLATAMRALSEEREDTFRAMRAGVSLLARISNRVDDSPNR